MASRDHAAGTAQQSPNRHLVATSSSARRADGDPRARTVELQQMTADLDAQRRAAECERRRLETLIKNLDDAVLVVGRGGATIVSNDAFVQLFEVDKVEPLDEHGRPIPLAELRARTARGESFDLAFSVVHAGRRRWFEASARPQPADLGMGEGGILVVHDTSDLTLRRLHEEFMGIVAHELRTPLTALHGYVQMLQRAAMGTPDPRILALVAEQVERLQRLTDELFDVTLADHGRFTVQPRRVALGRLVRDAVEIARGLANHQDLTIEDSAGELIVDGDASRLQQLLLNLLTNAIIHAPDSPEIIIRLKRLRGRAQIEIADRGPGIPRERQAEIFDRFARGGTAGRGLGLGLYISREIVLAHGGSLDVDSQVGEGTTFTIRLPIARKADGRRAHHGGTLDAAPIAADATAGDGDDGGNGTGNSPRASDGGDPSEPQRSKRRASADL